VPVALGLLGYLLQELDLAGFLEAGDEFAQCLGEAVLGEGRAVGADEEEEEGERDVAAGVLQHVGEQFGEERL
jgi:hypothetical protein